MTRGPGATRPRKRGVWKIYNTRAALKKTVDKVFTRKTGQAPGQMAEPSSPEGATVCAQEAKTPGFRQEASHPG